MRFGGNWEKEPGAHPAIHGDSVVFAATLILLVLSQGGSGCFEQAGDAFRLGDYESSGKEEPQPDSEPSGPESPERSDAEPDGFIDADLEPTEFDASEVPVEFDVRKESEPSCSPGTADCDEDPLNGCEADLMRDPDNCGDCLRSCKDLYPHAEVACIDGECFMTGCESGWNDLDENEPGCEYGCTPSQDGNEVCNAEDDDCDGVIDGVCDFGEPCRDTTRCSPGLSCTSDYFSGREHDGTCTAFCYSTYEVCPPGFGCNTLSYSDSMGYCEDMDAGSGMLGEACTTWKDCASTWCLAGYDTGSGAYCSDKCSSQRHCKAAHGDTELSCRLFQVDYGGKTMYQGLCARQPEAGAGPGEACNEERQCIVGMCLETGDEPAVCRNFCCSSLECSSGEACRLALSSSPDFPGAYVRACMPVDAPGTSRATRAGGGAFCASDRDCASNVCDSSIGNRCLDFCCNDSDCSGGTKCRPAPVDADSSSYGMLCLPGDTATSLSVPAGLRDLRVRGLSVKACSYPSRRFGP